MDSILTTKAFAIRAVKADTSSGAIKLDGFDELFQDKDQEIVILDGISYAEQDVVLPVVALDDKRVFYSFGKNFGSFSLNGTIYINKCESGLSQKVKQLQDKFEESRVSKKPSPVNLSALQLSAKVYVTGVSIGQANPATQTVSFEIQCTVAPTENKGG